MCGLVLAVSTKPIHSFIYGAHNQQGHRGPDGQGFHFEDVHGIKIGMAHQRLAIVGLSKLGTQPMISSSGRYRILFNGEIYNYRELARQFGLNNLKSETDTEVILELVERLGIDEALRCCNGMWSLAIQDKKKNIIYLARDRFGKKPLYIHHNSDGIYLASEMHSLLGLHSVSLTPDAVTAARFLSQSLQNIDERSWFEDIKSFPAASIAEIDISNPLLGLKNVRKFWSPVIGNQVTNNKPYEKIEELKSLVEDAIKIRLHADVAVGVALSGGIDSSIISSVAMNTSKFKNQVKMFSAVNPGAKEDESEHVNIIAEHLKADVQRFVLKPDEGAGLYELLKKCTAHADGPLSSFSAPLFYKLMQRARMSDITVVLTGQGADEVFCGYRKYPILEIKRLIRARRFSEALRLAAGFINNDTLLPQISLTEAKRYLGFTNSSLLGRASIEAQNMIALSKIDSLANRQLHDIESYSVPWLCHYEDRMSMAASREVRAPFLDYRVVEFGLQLPENYKLSKGWTKYLLRKAFESDLPAPITWRKDKKGFVNPQDNWLKGPLQQIVRELMSRPDAYIYRSELVDQKGYLDRFNLYCAGKGNVWFRDVFAPFALELWMRTSREIANNLRNNQCDVHS